MTFKHVYLKLFVFVTMIMPKHVYSVQCGLIPATGIVSSTAAGVPHKVQFSSLCFSVAALNLEFKPTKPYLGSSPGN